MHRLPSTQSRDDFGELAIDRFDCVHISVDVRTEAVPETGVLNVAQMQQEHVRRRRFRKTFRNRFTRLCICAHGRRQERFRLFTNDLVQIFSLAYGARAFDPRACFLQSIINGRQRRIFVFIDGLQHAHRLPREYW